MFQNVTGLSWNEREVDICKFQNEYQALIAFSVYKAMKYSPYPAIMTKK